jgi:DNA polymerase IIIc chi subunit
METTLPKILLFPVKSSKEKLFVLTKLAKEHFDKKEPLLFLAPNAVSAKFIDDLLWKTPEESFIPHKVIEEPCSELLAITVLKENLNQSIYFFNLCPEPLFSLPCRYIYEFDDQTIDKKEVSKFKFSLYRERSYAIELREVSYIS